MGPTVFRYLRWRYPVSRFPVFLLQPTVYGSTPLTASSLQPFAFPRFELTPNAGNATRYPFAAGWGGEGLGRMYDLTWLGWTVMALAAFLIGVSKTGMPGVGILSILMVTSVVPAKLATGLILPMLIVGDFFAVGYYRRNAVWPHLIKLVPFAMLGIILGSRAINYVSNAQLRPLIGGIILVMLILNWWRMRRMGDDIRIPSGWWFPAIMGIIAGVTTMMANAAGPVMIIYLLAMRLPKKEFLGTGAWYYLVLNCFKVPFSANTVDDFSHQTLINWTSLCFNLILLPLIAAGALIGVRLVKHLPEKAFAIIVQVLAVVGALYLLIPH